MEDRTAPVPAIPLGDLHYMRDLQAAQPGARAGYLNVAAMLRIIRRRSGMIAGIVLIAVALALLVVARTTPLFSATATVMVKPDETESTSAALPSSVVTPSQETEIETKVQLLQSRNLAREVARTLRLSEDSEFAHGEDERPGLLDRFLDRLSSSPTIPDLANVPRDAARAREEEVVDGLIQRLDLARVGRSALIDITASSNDPRKAALIANRVADTYIKSQRNESSASRTAMIADLDDRLLHARDDAAQADRAAAAFRRAHGLLNSRPEEAGVAGAAQLAGAIGQAEGERAASSRLASATIAGGATYAASPLLTSLREQETVLERRRAELASFYDAGYPDLGKTNDELAVVRSRIAQETASVRAGLGAQAQANGARAATIRGSAARITGTALGQSGAAVTLRELERRADSAGALYTALSAQLNARLSAQPRADADIAVVSRAPIPDTPSAPLPHRALGVAILASLGFGIILALVIEMMDIKLRTAEQVERLLGVPTLAMVPDTLQEGGAGAASHDLVNLHPRSRFAEAIRNLLIELEGRRGAGSHAVVVTSPLEAEGKNTISKSLAAAAARVGRRVVVVDFDLRRPEATLGDATAARSGVVGYLSGEVAFHDLAVVSDGQAFASLGTGQTPLDPGALLSSPRLPQLISQLRDYYDLVILNAPPILPVRDAKTLADVADSTLLVLRWGKTDPEAARVAVQAFGRPITGAVINMVDMKAHASRRYGDMIHHVSQKSRYYDLDEAARRHGLAARARRLALRAATALRLA